MDHPPEIEKHGKKKNPIISKKIFNKKKWRDQKYGAKTKVQNWENIKRRQALREYNKELKKSGDSIVFNRNSKFNKNSSAGNFKQAQQEYQKIQEEKERKRKEAERQKKERIEAIKAYKEKKAMRYRKLSQKTKKGQPLMKGRIELLLEKIQKEYAPCNNNKGVTEKQENILKKVKKDNNKEKNEKTW